MPLYCVLDFPLYVSVIKKKKNYLFIRLCRVLVAARGFFVAACGIFSCGVWDLVP